jgi:hypothetical protein
MIVKKRACPSAAAECRGQGLASALTLSSLAAYNQSQVLRFSLFLCKPKQIPCCWYLFFTTHGKQSNSHVLADIFLRKIKFFPHFSHLF